MWVISTLFDRMELQTFLNFDRNRKGHYRILMQGGNGNSIWNKTPLEKEIEKPIISPHWWYFHLIIVGWLFVSHTQVSWLSNITRFCNVIVMLSMKWKTIMLHIKLVLCYWTIMLNQTLLFTNLKYSPFPTVQSSYTPQQWRDYHTLYTRKYQHSCRVRP